jgi:outer membrane protein
LPLIALLLGMATALCAAERAPSGANDTAPLTFEMSVQRAAANNPALQSAQSTVSAAEQRVRAARSGFLPQISGSVAYSDTGGGAGPAGTDYSTGVTATQNLFAGFQDQAKVEQSRAQWELSQAALDLAKATLSRDLKIAFAGLAYAQDNVALTDSILRRLEENLRMVELRFEGGAENKGSVLLSRASVAQGRLDRIQALQALVSARAELSRALGDASAEWRTVNSVPLTLPPAAPDFDRLAQAAPPLRDAIAREQQAEAEVRLARAGFYPSVDLRGTRNRQGAEWFPSTPGNSVSATVTIPIFSGGRDYYGVRSALGSADAAKANRAAVEYQVRARLTQTYVAYVASQEQLRVNADFLSAAQTRAQIARARYQNGLTSFEDWDRIENELIQRQKASLTGQRDRVAAEAEWELAQGAGVIP